MIGDMWSALFGDDEKPEKMDDHIHFALDAEAEVTAGNKDGLVAMVRTENDGSLETMTYLQAGDDGFTMNNHFPVMTCGIEHEVIFLESETFEEHNEHLITIGFEHTEAEITYFDPDAPFKDSYEDSKLYRVSLSGFCDKVTFAPEKIFETNNDELIRWTKEQCHEIYDSEPDKKVEVSTKDMAALFSLEGEDCYPCEYQFQGPVKKIEQFTYAGESLLILTVTLLRKEDAEEEFEDIDAAIYVPTRCIKDGYQPKVGDDVWGLIWLQGLRESIEENKEVAPDPEFTGLTLVAHDAFVEAVCQITEEAAVKSDDPFLDAVMTVTYADAITHELWMSMLNLAPARFFELMNERVEYPDVPDGFTERGEPLYLTNHWVGFLDVDENEYVKSILEHGEDMKSIIYDGEVFECPPK